MFFLHVYVRVFQFSSFRQSEGIPDKVIKLCSEAKKTKIGVFFYNLGDFIW